MNPVAVARAGALTTAGGVLVGAGRRWARSREPVPGAPGVLVPVDGEDLHCLVTRGAPGPTVVFESALACPATEFAWVQRSLGGEFSSLAYDRPGNGWSSRRGAPAVALPPDAVAHRLRALLDQLQLPPPFVLVGHSIGGLLVRAFAARHPTEIAAMVLVDASHPDQLTESQVQREGMSVIALGLEKAIARTTLKGRFARHGSWGALDALPDDLVGPTAEALRHPGPWRGARQEFGVFPHSWCAAARVPLPRPDLPLAVLTAGRQAAGDPVHARLQADLATLSTAAVHRTLPDADHDEVVARRVHAQVVARAVRELAGLPTDLSRSTP